MSVQGKVIAQVLLRSAGLLGASAATAIGAASWLAYRKVTRPPLGVFETTEPAADLPHESVSLTSADGTRLAAWFIPGARPQPILVIHGYTATKNEMLHHAAFLNADGFPVLLLDLRCCGESEGKAVTFGGREREDVLAALAHLRDRPDVDGEHIGILGLSLGGALALMAATECPAVRAVVAESSFRDARAAIRRNFQRMTRLPYFPVASLTIWLVERRWGIRAAKIAPELAIGDLKDCAVLLIHAENDEVVSVQDAHALFSAAREPKELWLVPDAVHAMAFRAEREGYATRVTEFFARWLDAEAPGQMPAEIRAATIANDHPRERAKAASAQAAAELGLASGG